MNRARPMATQLIKRKENIYIKHKHNRLRDSRLYLVLPSDYLRLVADKTTKKKNHEQIMNPTRPMATRLIIKQQAQLLELS